MPNLTPVMVDASVIRARLHAKTINTLQGLFPLDLKGRTLELTDAKVHAKDFSPEEQKHALMTEDTLNEAVRGTLTLRGADGKIVDQAKNFTLLHLPYFTERHTVISGGNEYQIANMLRRKPGVYTQRGENNELHTTFNLSKGRNFDLGLNEKKGTFYIQYGTSNIPLYPVLRALGVPHEEIANRLGGSIAGMNKMEHGHQQEMAINKLYTKLVHESVQDQKAPLATKLQAIKDKFALTMMDPDVTHVTLGERHDKVTTHALLNATRKLLRVHEGKQEVDDADSLAFKTFHSVDDFISERIKLTARAWAPKVKMLLNGKSSIRESLKPAPFSEHVKKFITTSALTAVPTGINPIELFDHAVKVTSLGEGGIPSDRAIPYEARMTHPTHLGILDPIRTPECYSHDTEVFTSKGWKNWPDVTEDDLLACRIANRLEYHKPIRLIAEHYTGPLYGVKNGKLSYLVTPNHRVYCAHVDAIYPNEQEDAWQIIRADVLHGKAAVFDTAPDFHVEFVASSESDYVIEPYDDMVYCAEVPGGLLYVRRGGMVPLWSGNSGHAGVDIRASISAHRDDAGNLYTPMLHPTTGEQSFMQASEVHHKVIAFPHQVMKGMIDAIVRGKVQKIDAKEVDYVMPHVSYGYSPATTLIPFLHNIQGNRAIMGSKMQTQGLPLVDREVPLVQVKSHMGDHSFETVYGHMVVPTAPVSGRIVKIDRETGYIHIRPDTAKKAEADEDEFEKDAADATVKVPFQTYFPFPSKTALHHTIDVKVGDRVEAGQRLGDSNFTRNGTLALGKNLSVAYMAYYGLNSNDAVVISEGCAKKLTSEHMYRETYAISQGIEVSREKHKMYFATKYQPSQYAGLDETGVIKKGARVHHKDFLVVGLMKNQIQGTDAMLGRISKALAKPFREATLTWEHGTPGEVIDVVRSAGQIAILVKTLEVMQVGDKLCYDEQTDVLTSTGWKPIHEVKLTDKVATLQDEELVFTEPTASHKYPEGGRMYRLDTQQVDLFVTEAHRMWVRPRNAKNFEFAAAKDVAGKRVQYKKDAQWQGIEAKTTILPAMKVLAGQSGNGSRMMPELRIPAQTYAILLGAFVSEGNLVDQPDSGAYGIDITQIKEPNRALLLKTLNQHGVDYSEHGNGQKVRLYSKQLLEHFRPLGKSHEKYLPQEVFDWDVATLKILFKWLMWGDGHSHHDRRPISYTTTSPRLADDVQRLALLIGYAANIKSRHEPVQTIKGEKYNCRRVYAVRIVTTKLQPMVNHGHSKTQNGQRESWVENYTQPVYCLTVPSGVLYVRRNGKPVWSGNSGRYGNKGVVAKIIPDHEMIQSNGKPIDLLLTSAGVISRINPAQLIETAIAKVADKTGKPIVYDNADHKDATKWAKALLKKHGISEMENVFDPVNKRFIRGPEGKGVHVGKQYIFKLFKSTDTNFAGHGVGPYDINEQPLKSGGDEGAKGLGKMEFDALLAHNARNILHETATIKGTKNDEFWRAIQLGQAMPTAKSPFAWNKFTAMLEGAGIKVDKRGSKLKLLPLTDKDVLARSRGAIENNKTLIAKNLQPEVGGLFDPRMTGGAQGTLYSHINLHEPIVNPVFEEPVRRLLGWTQKQFEATLADKGGEHIKQLLAGINVGRKITELRDRMNKAHGAELNDLIKQVKYLEALQREGMRPHEAYVISKVPVIPPVFRPILPQPTDQSQLMVADANKLYAHLMDSNHVHKNTVLQSDIGKHRMAVYNALGAVYGTHEVENTELKGQAVKGFLTQIAGAGSPKSGFFQRKLMKRTQDVSGRGTAVPDGNLGMDDVGIPIKMLWQMFDKLLVARLVRTGYPALEARRQVDAQTPAAKDALMLEIKERPVMINRAPTLHRYSIFAAYAKPVAGKTIRVNAFSEKGLNLDYDGDTLQVHAPITMGAIEDTKRMTLSHMLLSDQTRNKLMVFPQHEAIMGVTLASKATMDSKAVVKHFPNREAVLAAWRRGEIGMNDSIEVANEKKAEDDDEGPCQEDGHVVLSEEDALSLFPPAYITGENNDA